jgi:hypothetical protein
MDGPLGINTYLIYMASDHILVLQERKSSSQSIAYLYPLHFQSCCILTYGFFFFISSVLNYGFINSMASSNGRYSFLKKIKLDSTV